MFSASTSLWAAIGCGLVVIGWFVSHRLTVSRERKASVAQWKTDMLQTVTPLRIQVQNSAHLGIWMPIFRESLNELNSLTAHPPLKIPFKKRTAILAAIGTMNAMTDAELTNDVGQATADRLEHLEKLLNEI